jgi:hypothetical protein
METFWHVFLDALRAAPVVQGKFIRRRVRFQGIAATVEIAAWLEFDVSKDTVRYGRGCQLYRDSQYEL